ncbi:hypothetical protein OUZ56_030803 [Daphnia magna]|uniref:Uncharacterized protein n=1 Tax=Daphnia magna TaxID=35525 RepID=A0ABQ9ZSC5_9CRUS|nr:hypothetical protein OUZ56_030803 [Daphnia magna]
MCTENVENIDDDCCCRSRNIALTVVQTTLEWFLDTKMTSCSRSFNRNRHATALSETDVVYFISRSIKNPLSWPRFNGESGNV